MPEQHLFALAFFVEKKRDIIRVFFFGENFFF